MSLIEKLPNLFRQLLHISTVQTDTDDFMAFLVHFQRKRNRYIAHCIDRIEGIRKKDRFVRESISINLIGQPFTTGTPKKHDVEMGHRPGKIDPKEHPGLDERS